MLLYGPRYHGVLLMYCREFLPVVSSLRHSSFFEGVVVRDMKLAAEVLEELCLVLRSSHVLKTLVLSSCGLKQ